MSYKHLSLEERHYIEISYKKGVSINQISKDLERSQATISREIQRNKGKRGYRHKQAERYTKRRHQNKPKQVKLTEEIIERVEKDLYEDWSPEQIVGRLNTEKIIKLHHETIYQYILKDKRKDGLLYKQLRRQGRVYRKRYGNANNHTGIPDRVDISERPEIVNNRERVGDWEGDTIVGKNHKGSIVTLDERVSKLRFAYPLNNRKADAVKDAINKLLSPIKKTVKTITFDNGKEFTEHKDISTALECDVYFAKPYSSWQRGQNENANGLLRQYFPKGIELIDIKLKEVFQAVHKLNSRPRKCLGYKTPYEVFKELTSIDIEKMIGYALMT